eukprot:gb/GECG01016842.1/.p1 GENE.gb/GECG01016842.1/~~gb/GECG01016842.1/.p1  ORF type:complete len:248 (+),score=35.83 gb/GECG01016842.1/:1-744(+)
MSAAAQSTSNGSSACGGVAGHKRLRDSSQGSHSSSVESHQHRHKEIYKALKSETDGFLPKWFREERDKETYELEVRFPDVDKRIFETVLNQLRRNPHWSSQFVTESTDKFFSKRKRATFEEGKDPVIITKERVYGAEDVLVHSLDRVVRFSLQNERMQNLDGDEGEPNLVRKKTRYTFVHKDEIKYELTRVGTSGSSQHDETNGDSTHEIELEWCGKYKNYDVEMCVQKLLFKVADMLLMIQDVGRK